MVFMWQSLILVVEFIICFGFAVFIYHQLGSFRHRPWYVTFLTLLGWIFCFFIVFLVPNDVAQAAQCNVDACDPPDNIPASDCTGVIIVPPNLVKICWQIVYWSTLFLTWGVYPIMQTYSTTGEFTFGEKMQTSVKSNLLLYSVMGAVLAVVGIFTIINLHISPKDIPSTIASAANAYGLFLLIAMLGHGLVNVPRKLWRRSRRELNLKRYYFDVARFEAKVFETEESLKKTLKKVRKASEITTETDSYRKYIDILISKCPVEEYNAIPYGDGNIELEYNKLALLHEKLMREDHYVKMYRELFNHSVEQAIRCEDILNSKGNGNWEIKWTLKEERTHVLAKTFNVLEYFWFCYFEARVYQILCVVMAALSIIIVWSELLFSACTLVGIDLSIFSRFIRAIATAPPFILQIMIFLPVIYIAWCAYSSLFQLRLFNYYHIVPHHMSDSNSLLFSAAYLCRLTAPMAYNFMQMSHYTNTTFVNVMGNLDIDFSESSDSGSSASSLFQTFFPVLLLPFILMTLFDVYSKILGLLRIKRFQFTDDFNHSLIEDGQEILAEERTRRVRDSRGFEDIAKDAARANEERSTTSVNAARRATNSRGVQFNRNDEEMDSFEEPENAPGSTKDLMGVGARMKSGFLRLIGKGNDYYEEEKKKEEKERKKEAPERPRFTDNADSAPALFASKKKEAPIRPYTHRTSELPTFNLDEDSDDNVWNDFDDNAHPL